MSEVRYFDKPVLDDLIQSLMRDGYSVVGPQVRDHAIVYDRLTHTEQLPRGVRDAQHPGRYRLEPSESEQLFEFNLGPDSWKKFLFPPRQTLLTAREEQSQWKFTPTQPEDVRYAFLGVRACELAAIAAQDRVFLEGPYVDPIYAAHRRATFIIAVNCTVASAQCFCTSMGTGPRCRQGFDLALTELDSGFVAEAASGRGAEYLAELNTAVANKQQLDAAVRLRERAGQQIRKTFASEGVREDLLENLDHPHWDDVASRCLSCTNCTMVCPTCFCTSVEDVSSLTGDEIERVRHWDSCFNFDFSYTAGGVVRDDRRSRFRQWLTHKLATWHDQFDSSGCVGCGRCITWCPVGIDLTAEVAALRQPQAGPRQLPVLANPATTATDPPAQPASPAAEASDD